MEKQQFKAESKRLLDMMINSIYTHQEIFLREIISNASDAIDKLAYVSLTDQNVGINRDEFEIRLTVDKDQRTLTVTDNGIGMDKSEMENNLGTIAKSGSKQFKETMEAKENIDIIGQFGVGFYSAFMVAEEITVISKKYGETEAYCWKSSGVDGYTIEPCDKNTVGTQVIMKLNPDTEEENYSQYLESWQLQSLVKKYSDYIRYPIRMMVERSRVKEGTQSSENPEFETYTEDTVINSMIPIWQRNKKEVTEEEYNTFYRECFHDYDDPLAVIPVSVEGNITYKALLFIPANIPMDFNTKDFKKSVQLYSSGVMIMENCEDLLPDSFAFVKGIVDSPDLSLNISRELLQHDRQLKIIAKNLEKKVRQELLRLQKDEREKYEKTWENFGRIIKVGVIDQYGAKKEDLQDLLMFYSANTRKLESLQEYVDGMPENQNLIYFASGENKDHLADLPQMERLKNRGYDVLLFTDAVDDFIPQTLRSYKDKEFRSILAKDLELDSEEDKKAIEEQAKEDKDILEFLKKTLDGKVSEVVLSANLGSHAVSVRPGEGVTFEMEKYFNRVNPEMGMKAERILELNPDHKLFGALKSAMENNREKAELYAQLLYNQAMLLADMPVENPMQFVDAICNLMI